MTYRTASTDRKWYFHNFTGAELDTWPEDTWDSLLLLWELFKLKPPSRKKQKAFWIQGIRDLIDAAGEFGVRILEDVNKEWRSKFDNGVAPYTVAGPQSLVKAVMAKAAEKRTKPDDFNKYITGEFAEFIEN